MLEDLILAQIEPNDTILDIGCGIRNQTRKLDPSRVTSLDAWEKVNPDVLIDLEKEKLPFPENSFDVILMIDFIEHLDKPRGIELIEECKIIARKKIVLWTPTFWTDNSVNVNNPDLWCYGNKYDYHKSLWTAEDFKDGWTEIPQNDYYFGVWKKG